MFLPYTPPPSRPNKRKINGLESTEEDEASVNRKTKISRFIDPKPTRNVTSSNRLLDRSLHMNAVPPSQTPENNQAAVADYSKLSNHLPVNHAPTQQPIPQPQSQSRSRPQPQPPQPLQPQPQSQPSQAQQFPRSIAKPVVAAPSTPGSTDTKKYTPKPEVNRTQTPGDGALGTPTPSATPVQATPQFAPQHLRPTNHPASHPVSQSPHPTAIVNGTAKAMGSSPRVAPSPTVQSMSMGASMNPAMHEQMAATQAQGPNTKAGVMGQQSLSAAQQPSCMMQAQAQVRAHAQSQGQAVGQDQVIYFTSAPLRAQAAHSATQVAQTQALQAQQQNVQALHLSHSPTLNPAVGVNGNSQTTSRSPVPNVNGQNQHVTPRHFATYDQPEGQQSPHQHLQRAMAFAQAKAQDAAHSQLIHVAQVQAQAQAKYTSQIPQMFVPMNIEPGQRLQLQVKLQVMYLAAQTQAQAGVRL